MAKIKEDLNTSSKLSDPDKLVIKAQARLKENQRYASSDRIVNIWGDPLTISVTENNVGRALQIMDVFLKIIKKKGYSIEHENRVCFLVIHGEKIEFYLREKLKRVEVEKPTTWEKYKKIPTGKLAFKVKIRWQITEWEDGKLTLEEQLPRIIESLEISGNKLKQQSIEREARLAAERKKEELYRANQKKKDQELQKFKSLLDSSRKWKEAQALREFLDATESDAERKGELEDEFNTWLLWARKKADWYDPLVKSKDEVLDMDDETS